MSIVNITDALKYGILGLCSILALLNYRLLRSLVPKSGERPDKAVLSTIDSSIRWQSLMLIITGVFWIAQIGMNLIIVGRDKEIDNLNHEVAWRLNEIRVECDDGLHRIHDNKPEMVGNLLRKWANRVNDGYQCYSRIEFKDKTISELFSMLTTRDGLDHPMTSFDKVVSRADEIEKNAPVPEQVTREEIVKYYAGKQGEIEEMKKWLGDPLLSYWAPH